MTESDKERILDIVYRAMSAAVDGEAIPVKAEYIADVELAQFLDTLINEEEIQDSD